MKYLLTMTLIFGLAEQIALVKQNEKRFVQINWVFLVAFFTHRQFTVTIFFGVNEINNRIE